MGSRSFPVSDFSCSNNPSFPERRNKPTFQGCKIDSGNSNFYKNVTQYFSDSRMRSEEKSVNFTVKNYQDSSNKYKICTETFGNIGM